MDLQRRNPQQIITECEKAAQQFVRPLLLEYINEVEARLMEFADKAKSNAQQAQLLEVCRDLRKQKVEIEVGFIEELRNGFNLFQRGKLGGQQESREDVSPNLSLMANDKLEVELAQSSFARRAETRYSEELFALSQRFSMLTGGRKIADDSNPLGPAQLANCLQQGITSLTREIKIIILLYKIFEKITLPQLGKLYGEVNNSLVTAGVLPNLRYSVTKQPATTAGGTSGGAHVAPTAAPGQSRPPATTYAQWLMSRGAPTAMAPSTAPAIPAYFVPVVPRHVAAAIAAPDANLPSEQYQQELYGAIRTMQQSVVRPANWRKPGAAATAHELVSVLQHAQTAAASSANRLDDEQVAPCETVNAPGAVSQQLQEEVNKETGKNVNEENANIIDLVGMIFEYMLGDNSLPDNVKAVLSYLHTPYLKIAFLDQELFAKPEHPARLLLNALEQTGSRWVNNDGTSQFKAFPKIKATVRRVLTEFASDLKLIDELLDDIREFNEKVQGNVDLLEQRAAQKAEGEDKLKQMKKRVNLAVKQRLEGKKLPSPLMVLLLHPWSEYLTFVLLRHGEDSESWHQSLKVIDNVIWSIQPKATPVEQQKLRDMQDGLRTALQQAFDSIAYDQAKAKRLLDAIKDMQTIALQNRATQPAPAEVRQEIEATAVGHEEAAERDMQPKTPEEQELVEKLKIVEFGTWIDFDELASLRNQRLKIAWYNAKTSQYMLVNRAGKQAAVLNAVEIARHMLAKNARIISGTAKPFFERALENIFSRLQANAA